MGVSLTPSNSATIQNSWWAPQVSSSVPQDTSFESRPPILLTSQPYNSGLPWPLLGFNTLLEELTELSGRHFTYCYQFTIKDALGKSQMEKIHGTTYGGRCSELGAHQPLAPLWSPTQFLQTPLSGFMEAPARSTNQSNHWSLVTGGCGGSWQFHPSSYMVGPSVNQSPAS